MKKIKYILVFVAATLVNVIVAQTFTAKFDKSVIKLGEKAELTFALNRSNGEKFTPPNITNLDNANQHFYMGETSKHTNHGGDSYDSIFYIYKIIPYKTGKYIIDPASIDINGKTIYSNSLIIEVLEK